MLTPSGVGVIFSLVIVMELIQLIDHIHAKLISDYGAMSHHLQVHEYIEYIGVDIRVLGRCMEVMNGMYANHPDIVPF